MASLDYCYWRGERCRFESVEWECTFHRAFQVGDTRVMADELLDISIRRLPAGLIVESVTRRRKDGAFVFKVIALPDDEQGHPILAAAERGLAESQGDGEA